MPYVLASFFPKSPFCFFCLIIWQILTIGNVQGQNLFTSQFTKVANLEGLKVKCILQDKQGFMWFGTETGLYRYDGYNTYVLTTNTPGRVKLSANTVLCLYEDQQGNMWIGTQNGINQLSADRKTIKAYLTTYPATAAARNAIQVITQTHDGAIWCSSDTGYLYRYTSKKEFSFVANVFTRTNTVLFPSVTHLSEDADHNIWIADKYQGFKKLSLAGVILDNYPIPPNQRWIAVGQNSNPLFFADEQNMYFFSPTENNFKSLKSVELSEYLKNGIRYVHQDKKGFLWLVTREKLIRFNAKTKQITDFTEEFKITSANHLYIDYMYEGTNGQLWFGSYFGVFRLDNREKFFNTISLPKGVGADTYFSTRGMVELANGSFYIGSLSGFFRFDPNKRHFQEFKIRNKNGQWVNPLARALVKDRTGNIWIATEGNGLLYFNTRSNTFSSYLNKSSPQANAAARKPSSTHNFSLLQDADGLLWLGGYENLYQFNPQKLKGKAFSSVTTRDTFFSRRIMTMHQDKAGTIWVGTDNGLYKISKGKGVVAHYTAALKYNHRIGLTNNFINCIYEDPEGRLWLGTKGGGINVLNPKNGQVEERYTAKEGLANDIVCAILPGKSGELWISTDNGLSRLDLRQKVFRNFYTRDGLPGNEFNQGSAFIGQDSTLYFGGIDGITFFKPGAQLPKAEAPQLMFTKLVQHNGRKNQVEEKTLAIQDLQNINLHYKDRYFTVYFAFKDYFENAVSQCQFAYRLEGVINEWQNIRPANYIQFAGLPAGEYILHIKGMDSNGIWGKELQIPVLIEQAFYLTTGAYVFYILVALGIIGIFFRSRINQIRLQNQFALEHLQKEQLQEVAQMKSQFFTNITHEFRTPLTLIISPLEQLGGQMKLPPPEIIRQYHQVIYRNAQHLLRLINQLLDSAKLEAGSMGITETRGDIVLFMGQIVQSFRLPAEKKNIKLQYVSPEESLACYFDAEKLERIIYNLLSNALKFTPSGGSVRVDCSLNLSDKEKSLFKLQVTDTGVGIPATQLPFVFDRFYQVNGSGNGALAGSGLGLFLVKELSELLGGYVQVESKEGKGTTFTVNIPVRMEENPAFASLVTALPANQPYIYPKEEEFQLNKLSQLSPDAPLVLVVEDHDELRTFVSEGLAGKYRVITAANGEEGWKLAQQELPDLIIADVTMPVMDGFTLCQQVKSTLLTSHIAIILLTARASTDSRLQGLATGANDYLTKPFNLQELQLRVANWLSYQQTLRQYWYQKLRQPNGEEPESLPEPPAEDPFLLKVNQVLDRELANSNFTVEQFAAEMAVTSRTLHRKLSALTGMNATELMRSYRLRKAAAFLAEGYTVSETAYKVGFESLSYFSKCFKEHYSKSPSQYSFSKAEE